MIMLPEQPLHALVQQEPLRQETLPKLAPSLVLREALELQVRYLQSMEYKFKEIV